MKWGRVTGCMYRIQAPASLKMLYILLHFYHPFSFFQLWLSTLLDLVIVDKIILFTTKLYTNHHQLGCPNITLFLTVILKKQSYNIHLSYSCYEESVCK